MIARCDFWVAAGFRVLTRNHVERLRGGLARGSAPSSLLQGHPPSLRFGHPDVATDGTGASARTRLTTTQHTKRRQPSPPHTQTAKPPRNRLKGDSSPPPHTQNAKPPSNRLKGDSLPRASSLGTGRTQNHRESTATPAGPQRTPNTDTRRGAYILCRDIRVSELCEDGSPAGAKRIICTSSQKNHKIQGTQKSRRFRGISGIFFEVRPLGLEPRTH